MLRMIVGRSRQTLQPNESDWDDSQSEGEDSEDEQDTGETNCELVLEVWVSWIKRTTDYAEQQLARAQITDWVAEQRKRYWQLAG